MVPDTDIKKKLGEETCKRENYSLSAGMREKMEKKHAPIIRGELEAFEKAWELLEEGDILLFLYTNFSYIQQFFNGI
ncbi:MAG TPA: hypothetical protein VNM45_09780 [Bacillus sp. (in: firmicutes)]|nr:hypothetical protein [Bacillus sp. (in: firmicutes)]